MADIVMSTLEGAIRDGITLLTQRRFHRDAPPYLLRPRSQLVVDLLDFTLISSKNELNRHAKVLVRCATWGDTDVTLELTAAGGEDDWLIWGDFSIRYGVDYPLPRLRVKKVTKSIHPYVVTLKGFDRPLEYRIRPVAR